MLQKLVSVKEAFLWQKLASLTGNFFFENNCCFDRNFFLWQIFVSATEMCVSLGNSEGSFLCDQNLFLWWKLFFPWYIFSYIIFSDRTWFLRQKHFSVTQVLFATKMFFFLLLQLLCSGTEICSVKNAFFWTFNMWFPGKSFRGKWDLLLSRIPKIHSLWSPSHQSN